MSYGLVGDGVDTFGPTTSGMRLLRITVLANNGYPMLSEFVTNGETLHPQEVAKEAEELCQLVSDEDLKHTLEHLALVSSLCKENLVLC